MRCCRRCLAASTARCSSASMRSSRLISGHGMCSQRSGARARSPQRHPRAVQPQARADAGQPVAVRAVCRRASASAWRAGAWRRSRSAWSCCSPARARRGSCTRWCCCGRAGACSGGSACWSCSPFGAIALVVLGALRRRRSRERIERTTQLASANEAGVDNALSGRTRIWARGDVHVRARIRFNGVGARGFRESFAACDPGHGRAWRRGAKARRCTRTSGARSGERDRRVRPGCCGSPALALGGACLALRRSRRRANARARRCSRWR